GGGGLSEGGKGGFEEFGEHLSMCERRAVAAERGAMDRYVAAYMAAHVGASFPGRVTSVTRFGLFATLDGTGADGLIPIRSLGQEFFAMTKAARCWWASVRARLTVSAIGCASSWSRPTPRRAACCSRSSP